MKIIDFHTHPYTCMEESICHHKGHFSEGVDDIYSYMRSLGVSVICGSVLCGGITQLEGKERWEAIRRCNRHALMLKDRWGEFYIPGFHVSPEFVEESCREIEAMAKMGHRLIGELVPYLQGWSDYSSEAFDAILEVATQHKMVINLHTQGDDEMDRMVQKHPDTVFVAAHPGEKKTLLRHLERMRMSENYYLDLSGTGIARFCMLRRCIDEMGVERFLYGSDFPTCNPPVFLGGLSMDPLLSAEEKEALFHGNARRLLGIK